MARFKFTGYVAPQMAQLFTSPPPLLSVVLPLKNGTYESHAAPNQTTGFPVGQDLGFDITDARALRVMRADTNYQEIV